MAQFSQINAAYGAPMGRHGYGVAPQAGDGATVRLFRIELDSGGYDDGGAYWGHGLPLYCAIDTEPGAKFQQFVRAKSRRHAAELLEIDNSTLTVKV